LGASSPGARPCSFEELRGIGFVGDAFTFNTLLKSCMLAKDPERAEQAVAWMHEAGVAGDECTYNTLLKVPLDTL
jgi:pentatricopeptide repeat protein